MSKSAYFYIFAVNYGKNNAIKCIKAATPGVIVNMNKSYAEETIWVPPQTKKVYHVLTKEQVIDSLIQGKMVMTAIFAKDGKVYEGDEVITSHNETMAFIKTAGNDLEEDNLGELPKFLVKRASDD